MSNQKITEQKTQSNQIELTSQQLVPQEEFNQTKEVCSLKHDKLWKAHQEISTKLAEDEHKLKRAIHIMRIYIFVNSLLLIILSTYLLFIQ